MKIAADDPGNAPRAKFFAPRPVDQDRRSFLGALLGLGSLCVGALLAVPLIRFSAFPAAAPHHADLKRALVGPLADFASLSEPVARTIQIEQVDGWRKAISEKAVYVTKGDEQRHCVCSPPSVRTWVAPSPGSRQERIYLPLSRRHLLSGRRARQRPVSARHGRRSRSSGPGWPTYRALPVFPPARRGQRSHRLGRLRKMESPPSTDEHRRIRLHKITEAGFRGWLNRRTGLDALLAHRAV